jgi:cyanophycinase
VSSKDNGATPPPLYPTPVEPQGTLIIIGGRENKEGHRAILEELARRANGGKLVVATFGSDEPEEQWSDYEKVFRELGVQNLVHLDARRREELLEDPRLDDIEGAEVVFFGGGDQTKVTSRFGGTPLCIRIREMYEQGLTIAGTSSGASIMSEVMMAGGDENSSSDSGAARLAAGLGLFPQVIIDQHFAERGRISRLLKAVAQNPRMLGIGIDENTAILVDKHRRFLVMGEGAVYVVDGSSITYTNSADEDQPAPSIHGLTVHVLCKNDCFDMAQRKPVTIPREKFEEEIALTR